MRSANRHLGAAKPNRKSNAPAVARSTSGLTPIVLAKTANKGFTLIELLVVVTIIVVLLALLTPALDQAIYQAQLAVCGATLKTVAGAVTLYAYDFKRHYPYRGGLTDRSAGGAALGLKTHPIKIKDPILGSDDRRELRPYLTLNKMLMDPLGPSEVDLEGSHDDTHVYSTYELWFGWSFGTSSAGAEPGMFKIGDRFGWTDPVDLGGRQRRFEVLAGDFDRYEAGLPLGSHPDRTEPTIRNALVLQDKAAIGIDTTGGIKQTLSFWQSPGNPNRGLVDLNFAFADGSTGRYNDVEFNEWADNGLLVRVPEYPDGSNYPGTYNHLPIR
jgi:prepilin-type N-terminal cleavage/methylation domain-containing protein